MAEEEQFDMDEESDNEDVKKERDELNKLGVSGTWDVLTKPDSKKKEEKKPEFRGFK